METMTSFKRTPGEPIREDDIQRWDTSKGECLFDEKSIVKESLNNINYDNQTTTTINMVINEEYGSNILEITDNGLGFENVTVFDNAMKLSSTNGEGNNNYGIGLKSFMMPLNKSGIFILIAGNLEEIDIFGFFKKGKKPHTLQLNDDEREKLINYAEGKTVQVAIYGQRLFDDINYNLYPHTIDELISKSGYEYYESNGTNCELNEEDDENNDSLKSLSEYLSIDYYEKIKNGNNIILNGQPIDKIDIYGIDRVQSVETESGHIYYKFITEINIYKDNQNKYRRTLTIKGIEGNILHEQLSTEKSNRWAKSNPNNKSLIKKFKKLKPLAKYELIYTQQKRNIDNLNEKKIYIKSDGIFISNVPFPEISGAGQWPDMRCYIEKIIGTDDFPIINPKRNKSHTQIHEKEIPWIKATINRCNTIIGEFKVEADKFQETQAQVEQAQVEQLSMSEEQTHNSQQSQSKQPEEYLVNDNDLSIDSDNDSGNESGNEVSNDSSNESGNESGNKSGNKSGNETKKKRKRGPSDEFSNRDKKIILKNYPKCPITGILNETSSGGGQLFDYDHIIALEDDGTNDVDNGQAINPLAHAFKTRDKLGYKETIDDRTEGGLHSQWMMKCIIGMLDAGDFDEEQKKELRMRTAGL